MTNQATHNLYRERGLQLDREVAPHLLVREVVCRCPGGCGNHALDWELLQRWVCLRRSIAMPIRVTSGFRCQEHPVEARRVAQGRQPGWHSQGRALDLAWPALLSHDEFIRACQELFGDGGVGLYGWGVHVDLGPKRTWGHL